MDLRPPHPVSPGHPNHGPELARTPRRPNPTAVIAHIAFFTCICLQRFGVPFGEGEMSLSLPVLFLLVTWLIASRRASIPAKNALLYMLLMVWALICAFVAVFAPDPRVGFSIFSVLELLVLYMLLTVRPAGDFDAQVVQRVFLFYARLCAAAGIVQFLLQFVGVRIFSFGTLFPALNHWLLEKDFAWNPLLRYGSNILRSNGFFLLEPSMFSQVLGLAILLDFFILGRRRYLPLYMIAYVASYSGTGLLALVLTLGLIGLTSVRNSGRAVVIGMVAAVTLGLFSLAVPDQVGTFVGRFTELGSAKSSGHARYVAQIGQIQTFAGETRSLVGYGPGATLRSRSYAAGSGNPALQLFVDYGLVGLGLFYVFLIVILWRSHYAAMSIMFLINFQLGGGYLLFAPMTLLMAALGVWGAGNAPATVAAPVRRLQRRLSRMAGRRFSPVRAAG